RTIQSSQVLALNRRDDDRDQRLFEIVVAAGRPRILSELWARDSAGNCKINCRASSTRLRRYKYSHHLLGGSSRKNRTTRILRVFATARVSARLDRQRNCAGRCRSKNTAAGFGGC